MKRHFQALGRLKVGEMNKTEAAYAKHLEALKQAGLILWCRFDAVKLRLADNTFLTVDFFILNAQSQLEAHDVKGSLRIITDDAKVKMKVAADAFPFAFYYAVPRTQKSGGGWEITEI